MLYRLRPMPLTFKTALGLARSVWIYRANRAHHRSLVGFYRDLVPTGGLVFDIGAHVGDRIAACRALDARVVALEPQAPAFRLLQLFFDRDAKVSLMRAAVGRQEGEAVLFVNSANPTVSTLSETFVSASSGAKGWEGQEWDTSRPVPVTTLDALIAAYGRPDFIKIDVEGAEADVLAGLSAPVPLLSFEIVTMARDAGLAALQAAEALGYAEFRLSLGESHVWTGPWVDGATMRKTLQDLPDEANSGDVYARHPVTGA